MRDHSKRERALSFVAAAAASDAAQPAHRHDRRAANGGIPLGSSGSSEHEPLALLLGTKECSRVRQRIENARAGDGRGLRSWQGSGSQLRAVGEKAGARGDLVVEEHSLLVRLVRLPVDPRRAGALGFVVDREDERATHALPARFGTREQILFPSIPLTLPRQRGRGPGGGVRVCSRPTAHGPPPRSRSCPG